MVVIVHVPVPGLRQVLRACQLRVGAGYDAKQVRETLTALGDTAYIRPRGEEVQAKKVGQKS